MRRHKCGATIQLHGRMAEKRGFNVTISSTTDRASFEGNGSTLAFPLPFRFFSNGDIQASLVDAVTGEITALTLGIDYSLQGAGAPEQAGSPESVITMVVAPPVGKALFVQRVMEIVQPTDIVNQGRFFPEVHETVFDRLTMLVQQAALGPSRTIRVPESDPIPGRLPSAVARATKVFGFDGNGDPAVSSLSMSDIEAQVPIAAEAAAEAEASAIAAAAAAAAAQAVSGVFLTAAQFDLLGDGSDETAKVQAAITAAAAQRKMLVGDRTKTYKITSTVTGASHCHLKDFYIDASALTGSFKHALVFQGALAANSALTADVAANAFSATVADGSIYSPDEWLLLTVDTSHYPYSTYNVARGEWVQVRSISGNTVNFTTPLVQGYTTASGATLRKCNFVEIIVLDNVRVTGSGVPATGERGISFRFARFFEVKNCVMTNIDQYACEISSSIIFHAHHNRVRGTFYDGVTGTIFYAIVLLDSCQYFTVHDNHGARSRHLVVTTAASAGQGRWGQCMFGIIHDNVVEDCMAGGGGRSYAYEMHGTGQHLLWANNIANGCYSFMRIEGGSDSQVIGGGCNGYAAQGIIIGGSGQTVQRIDIRGVKLSNYTGEVSSLAAGVRFESTSLLECVTVDGVVVDSAAKSNVGSAISISTSTTCRNNVIKNLRANAGDVEANAVAVSLANGVTGFTFENCDLFGWRQGYNLATASKIVVRGGTVENFATAASGFGFYSNGDRNVCKGVHFRNINTAIRLDTGSTNNLAVENTFTDVTTPTPSNGGTGNVVTPNYTV